MSLLVQNTAYHAFKEEDEDRYVLQFPTGYVDVVNSYLQMKTQNDYGAPVKAVREGRHAAVYGTQERVNELRDAILYDAARIEEYDSESEMYAILTMMKNDHFMMKLKVVKK